MKKATDKPVKDFYYVNWGSVNKERLTWEQWNEIMEYYEKNGRRITLHRGNKTVRAVWTSMISYALHENNKSNELWCCDETGEFHIYYSMNDNDKNERPIEDTNAGYNAMIWFNNRFKELYSESLRRHFGTLEVRGGTTVLNRCVKSTCYALWVNDSVRDRRVKNVYKADIKSSWPYELSKSLPTMIGCKVVDGFAQPNKEYPFAFYVNSGHLAIYEELDTREMARDDWYCKFEHSNRENARAHNQLDKRIYYRSIDEAEERTVLCKSARNSLRPIVEELYQMKENAVGQLRDHYKRMLNAFIGYLCSVDANKYANMGHISAVVYARATARMIDIAHCIEREGGTPMMFSIDSILWRGAPCAMATDKSAALGSFVYEAQGATAVMCGQGQYFLRKPDGSTIEKHQGVKEARYKANVSDETTFVRFMSKLFVEDYYDKGLHKYIF